MKKATKKFLAGFAGLLLLCMMVLPVQAAGELAIVEKYTTEDGVVLYVDGVTDSVDNVMYQVGTTSCEITSIDWVRNTEEPICTLILWDNSLSVMRKCEDTVEDILIDIVANRADGEVFALATIDEGIGYLTDFTNDYAALKQTIEGVEGEDKDAYIIETLYQAIEALNGMDNVGYKRIIVISDGMDATEIGYSRSELDALIERTPYPIYTIGVLSGNSQDELQDMFALSRTTGADYFYLDEIEDPMTVVQDCSVGYDLVQVKAAIPAEIQDGSTQNSQLTFVSGDTNLTAQATVVMPFANLTAQETEPVETEPVETQPVEEEIVETLPIETETEEEVEEEPEKEPKTIELFGMEIPLMVLIGIIIGVVVLILVIVIIIVVSKSKKKKAVPANDYSKLDQQIKNERYSAPAAPNQPVRPAGGNQTNMLPNMGANAGTNKTQLLFGNAPANAAVPASAPVQAPAHRVTLTNVADAVKSYQCGMKDKIIVGRNPACCNLAIPTDNAVSEKHCEIGISGNKFYIKDLNSSNGTCVNNVRINVATEVVTGCIIKIGRTDYRITVE
ncbi:MAG: FHA domain-containing protein [Lachnospiraceae bacterium]|nr:FHA domain-containing protein [Lachnospiraceae bacterium]